MLNEETLEKDEVLDALKGDEEGSVLAVSAEINSIHNQSSVRKCESRHGRVEVVVRTSVTVSRFERSEDVSEEDLFSILPARSQLE